MQPFVKIAIVVVPFLVAISAAFRYMIKARTLEDIPTSKCRSAEQGYVELEGHAELLEGPAIVAPMSKRECVWWSYTVERRKGNEWTRIESESSDSLFAIRDNTGLCIVDPEGADVYPAHKKVWRGQTPARFAGVFDTPANYRYREYYLMPHELICVIGMYKTHNAIDHWDDEDELRRLLAEWKKDQPRLIHRFDTNKDGVLDQHEWEIAREEARKELEREKREHAVKPGVNVIGAPDDRRPFLIAPLSNSDFAIKLRRKALWSLAGAVAAALGLSYFLFFRG